MFLEKISLQNFRNYSQLETTFQPQGAVFAGSNGAGKTNLLEAIYLLCTGRSQRGASRQHMVQKGREAACARGVFESAAGSAPTTIQFGFGVDKRLVVKLNEDKSSSISQWFGEHKVVPFGPPDLLLIQGPPAERRRFMNMVLSQIERSYLDHLIAYKKALMNRNVLLCRRSGNSELEVYEEAMANHGSYLGLKRATFFSAIAEDFSRICREISTGGGDENIRYRPSHKPFLQTEDAAELRESLLVALSQRRARDQEYGFTSVGPHRDDFLCTVEHGRASQFASQGQCRTQAIALRLCSLLYIEESLPDEDTLILVDDAFCELDSGRVSRIYPLIKDKGQLFITSTTQRPSYADGLPGFVVESGELRAA